MLRCGGKSLNFPCEQCKSVYKSASGLAYHQRTVHNTEVTQDEVAEEEVAEDEVAEDEVGILKLRKTCASRIYDKSIQNLKSFTLRCRLEAFIHKSACANVLGMACLKIVSLVCLARKKT